VTKLSSVIKLAWAFESCGAILMLLAAGVNATAAAATSNDDMVRCAAIQAPDTRLSCYDTLAHRPPDKAPPAVVKAAPPAAPASSATSSSSASAAPVPAATAGQPPATVAAIAADPQNFGLTAVQQHTADLGPKSERAQISIVSSDQSGRTFVVLDSGQTWTVMDSDGRLNSGDAVTIKRAALGSFLMLTPSNHSYRVRRVK
jgi:hypothetical protein